MTVDIHIRRVVLKIALPLPSAYKGVGASVAAHSTAEMEFGSTLVYAPKDDSKQEYEHIPESRYNHVVKAYSSGASPSYDPNDDGQVQPIDPHY